MTTRSLNTVINQYGYFPLTVSRVQTLSPHFRRISLTGPSLHHAATPISDGTGHLHDAYIKLITPPTGTKTPAPFTLHDTWRQDWMSQPEHQRGALRTYTIHNSRLIPAPTTPTPDPLHGLTPNAAADLSVLNRPLPPGQQPEIDIDFALHTDPHGTTGPGTTWASQAQTGDPIGILAPLRQAPLWSSWKPQHKSILILADETAVPAALSILRTLPKDTSGTIYLEIPTAADDLTHHPDTAAALSAHPNISLTFLPRNSAQRGHPLTTTLRNHLNLTPTHYTYQPTNTPADEIVWGIAEEPTHTYVFIAGESSIIKTLRRTCITEGNIPKNNISFMGYWKDGRSEN